jgi:small GTP-binding protein
MLGDTFTGKTSLVLRFAEGYYRESGRSATVGAFFITKRLNVQGLTCKIQIWDTAGQEQFKKLAPMYYKNSAAAIVCYDVTSPKSFEALKYWVDELRTNVPADGMVLAVCATKCDLENTEIDTHQAEALAAEVGAMFMKTSAKDNVNVNEIFEKVAEQVLNEKDDGSIIPVTLGSTPVEMPQNSSPNRFDTPTTNPLGSSQSDRPEQTWFDEKKDEGDNDVVAANESGDSGLASKCDARKFLCADTEELMGVEDGQNCIIL